jgi:thiamine biosynthesis protein ThiS
MSVATMRVTINGKEEDLPADLTVAQLLERRAIHTTLVAVEHNGRILRRAEFPDLRIAPGDRLEIVHFVGGG